jgi:XTP/dITP diphosphohydrolase
MARDQNGDYFVGLGSDYSQNNRPADNDRWRGTILREPSGSGGFGYDPIFQPDGYPISSAELSRDEKDAVSHRALAFQALVPLLQALVKAHD